MLIPRFLTLSLLIFNMKAAAITSLPPLASVVIVDTQPGFEKLLNSAYTSKIQRDGSVTMRSIIKDDSIACYYSCRTIQTFALRKEHALSSGLTKRIFNCGNFQGELDHCSTDDAVRNLRDWAGSG